MLDHSTQRRSPLGSAWKSNVPRTSRIAGFVATKPGNVATRSVQLLIKKHHVLLLHFVLSVLTFTGGAGTALCGYARCFAGRPPAFHLGKSLAVEMEKRQLPPSNTKNALASANTHVFQNGLPSTPNG